MALVNRVVQRGYVGREVIIGYQIVTYCFLNRVELGGGVLGCLVLLAQRGECELDVFCREAAAGGLYGSAQTVRNVLGRLERVGLVVKSKGKPKRVGLHPSVALQVEGNILLDYQFACVV
jgi:hypothetical protein